MVPQTHPAAARRHRAVQPPAGRPARDSVPHRPTLGQTPVPRHRKRNTRRVSLASAKPSTLTPSVPTTRAEPSQESAEPTLVASTPVPATMPRARRRAASRSLPTLHACPPFRGSRHASRQAAARSPAVSSKHFSISRRTSRDRNVRFSFLIEAFGTVAAVRPSAYAYTHRRCAEFVARRSFSFSPPAALPAPVRRVRKRPRPSPRRARCASHLATRRAPPRVTPAPPRFRPPSPRRARRSSFMPRSRSQA